MRSLPLDSDLGRARAARARRGCRSGARGVSRARGRAGQHQARRRIAGPPRRATRARRRPQAGRDADARRDRRRRARRRARGVRPLLDEHARRSRRRVGPGHHGRHAVDGPLRRRSRARVRHRARERNVHAGELQPDAAADERRRRADGAVLSRPHARQRRHGRHEQEDPRGAEAGRHLSRHRPQRRERARAGATPRRCTASTRRRSRAR